MSIRSNLIYYAGLSKKYEIKGTPPKAGIPGVFVIPGMGPNVGETGAPCFDGNALKVAQHPTTGDIMVVTNPYQNSRTFTTRESSMIAIMRQDGSKCFRIKADMLFDMLSTINGAPITPDAVFIADMIPWKEDTFLLVGGMRDGGGDDVDAWAGLRMVVTGLRSGLEDTLKPLVIMIDAWTNALSGLSLLWTAVSTSDYITAGAGAVPGKGVFMAGKLWSTNPSVIPFQQAGGFLTGCGLYSQENDPLTYATPLTYVNQYNSVAITDCLYPSTYGFGNYPGGFMSASNSGSFDYRVATLNGAMRAVVDGSIGIAGDGSALNTATRKRYSNTASNTGGNYSRNVHYTPLIQRWQNGSSPDFPPGRKGVVESGAVHEGFSWQSYFFINPSAAAGAANGSAVTWGARRQIGTTYRTTVSWNAFRMSKVASLAADFKITPNFNWGAVGWCLTTGSGEPAISGGANSPTLFIFDPISYGIKIWRYFTANTATTTNAVKAWCVAAAPYVYQGEGSPIQIKNASNQNVEDLFSYGIISAFMMPTGEVRIKWVYPRELTLGGNTTTFRAWVCAGLQNMQPILSPVTTTSAITTGGVYNQELINRINFTRARSFDTSLKTGLSGVLEEIAVSEFACTEKTGHDIVITE